MTKPALGFILLGQSNMYGITAVSDSPADPELLELDPRCLNRQIVAGGVTIPASSSYGTLRTATGTMHKWLYANPGVVDWGGPGISIGRRLRALYPHLRIVMLATARPTTIGAIADTSSAEYADTIDTAIYARDTLGVQIGGVFTHHGEADAGLAPLTAAKLLFAQEWKTRYQTAMGNIRTALKLPALPCVHAMLGLIDHVRVPGTAVVTASPFYSLWEVVQESQEAVSLSYGSMIETHDFWDLPGSDGLHNTTAGNITEGTRFADAYAAIGHPYLTPPAKLAWRS